MKQVDGAYNDDVHIFDTLFFTQLKTEGKIFSRKWTEKRGVNIFEKLMLIIPGT